jgi:hypothetical protein
MNTPQTVDPRIVAAALQMDTHDLAKLLCTFASDALPVGTWLERTYKPLPLEDFDERDAGARRHLEAAHAAWAAWTAENGSWFEPDAAGAES